MPDILSSPEVAGKLGFNSTIIGTDQKTTVSEGLTDFAEGMREVAKESENSSEVLEGLLKLSDSYDIEDEVTEDTDKDDQPHFGFTLFGICINFLDELDDLTDAPNHEPISNFVDKLEKQGYLSNASTIILLYFASDEEFLYKYGNTFNRKLRGIVDDLFEIAETENPSPERMVEAYRPWGSLTETALPPVLTILGYLQNEEVDFDKADDMGFRAAVDKVCEFPTLEPLGERLHVDLRNSLSHGGRTGDYQPNPITEEITFWFEGPNGEERTLTLGFDEFQNYVIETLSAVICLFLLPLYILASHACIEIVSVQEDKE